MLLIDDLMSNFLSFFFFAFFSFSFRLSIRMSVVQHHLWADHHLLITWLDIIRTMQHSNVYHQVIHMLLLDLDIGIRLVLLLLSKKCFNEFDEFVFHNSNSHRRLITTIGSWILIWEIVEVHLLMLKHFRHRCTTIEAFIMRILKQWWWDLFW